MLLIFDFDGVLVDSLREVALNSYNCVAPTPLSDFSDLPPGYWSLFQRNRYLMQPAGDLVPFAAWCLQYGEQDPEKLLTDADVPAILASASTPLKKRSAQFFESRARLFANDPAAWFSLHVPFEPIWGFLKAHPKFPRTILTNKNQKAVQDLCAHFDLAVPENEILSGDGGARKSENLTKWLAANRHDSLSFIDDSVRNLIDLRRELSIPTPITLLHAAWGYVGPDDPRIIHREGFRSLSQVELIELLQR